MSRVPDRAPARTRALRGNSLGAVLLLLVEYGLGVWVNLYGKLPATDRGAGLASGFARALTDGPVGLSIHAALGVVLLGSAIGVLVRSLRLRRPGLTAAAAVGLVAVLAAGLSGSSFVGRGTNGPSMSMAVAAGVAIGAYALVLFLTAGVAVPSGAGPEQDVGPGGPRQPGRLDTRP